MVDGVREGGQTTVKLGGKMGIRDVSMRRCLKEKLDGCVYYIQ